MKRCERSIVTGRVQGVWFRQATLEQARELGLTGWVRNRADGAVEVLACGEEAQLQRLRAWLRQGPPMAQVAAVVHEFVDDMPPTDFEIRR
jgi:acylphosphatase